MKATEESVAFFERNFMSFSRIIRWLFIHFDPLRNQPKLELSQLHCHYHIKYGEHTLQTLDVYHPKDINKTYPIIFNVHGGGWVYGDKELYKNYCVALAKQGFCVINFNYRLSPEHTHPSQIQDINTVSQWIKENHSSYCMDLRRVFAIGDSAGAHLLALYCCQNRVPLLPQAIALNSGFFTFKHGRKYIMHLLTKEFLARTSMEEIEVLEHVPANFPSTFLLCASHDYFIPHEQATMFAEKLSSLHIPYILKTYGNKKNRLQHLFQCNMGRIESHQCILDQTNFFLSK